MSRVAATTAGASKGGRRRSAAFAMPSRNEGFGLVYLEAMKAGKPCVAARGSAAEEIVADGETGLLVEPGPEPLAAALAALLDDPARATRLGEAGRRRWEERLSFARFREALAALYLPRLLGEKAAELEPRPCAA